MKYIDMSIVNYINFFIILEIKAVLITHRLSKATSKAAENNRPIGLISPHSAPCRTTASGAQANQMMVTIAKSS